jgi:hypothetical protein
VEQMMEVPVEQMMEVMKMKWLDKKIYFKGDGTIGDQGERDVSKNLNKMQDN